MLEGKLLITFFAITHVSKGNAYEIVTSTPAGAFRGVVETTRDGQLYYAFKGIPYAETPGRFEVSDLKAPIDGEYDATHDRSICPQEIKGQIHGNEDCLFLAVSHPHPSRCTSATTNGLLPVMFWIHPGGFKEGSGSAYQPTYLLDKCVVLVTINYRIGAFGFLTTEPDMTILANLGLKDQLVALKWNRKYIQFFRGDPNTVTIFGSGVGGASVNLHMCSPASKGLFHRAIAMSGAILNPWSDADDPLDDALRFGSILNCPPPETGTVVHKELRACLLEKSTEEIVAAQSRLSPPEIVFYPTIENIYVVNPFRRHNPWSILEDGEFGTVPFMIGFVEDEGIYHAAPILADQELLSYINKHWTAVAPTYMFYHQFRMEDEERDRLSNEIRRFYFNHEEITESRRQDLVNLASDRGFVQGIYQTAQLALRHTSTYMYVNTYKGGISYAHTDLGYTLPVITHLDDEQYIFPKFQEWTSGPNYQFSLDMVELWTNFATYGKPFGKLTQQVPWDPLKPGPVYSKVYNLDAEPSIFHSYLDSRREFWKALGIYYHEYAYATIRE